MKNTSLNSLVQQYLGAPLPTFFDDIINFQSLSIDAQECVRRALDLMKRSNYSPSNFSPHLMRWLFVTIPSILPSAWGGRIPPLTLPGRHKKLDEYVANTFNQEMRNPVFIDVGCGFPPVTSFDTASAFPNWQVYGVDTSFAAYVLYDNEGHYACFNQQGKFEYFQAMKSIKGRALYESQEAARNHFNKIFEDLAPLITNNKNTASETVEKDGFRLVINHILDYETDNLTFIETDINELQCPPAMVVRCMNVLIYFEASERQKMISVAESLLKNNGLLIAGSNGLGIQTRYTVHRKGPAGIKLSEFAFSLDNLGHISFMPWFTIQKSDPEARLLAELSGAVKNDIQFFGEFSHRLDELLNEYGICERGPDGYLHFPENEMEIAEYMSKNTSIWKKMEAEGFTEGVVEVLNKCGYQSWKNLVNDIAVQIPKNSGLQIDMQSDTI